MAYPIELKQKALAYLDKIGNISKVCVAYGILATPYMNGLKNRNKETCPVKAAAAAE